MREMIDNYLHFYLIVLSKGVAYRNSALEKSSVFRVLRCPIFGKNKERKVLLSY